MLALAHRAHGGLLHETVMRARILSMNGITAELDAHICPSGAWWAAERGYRVGLHTSNAQHHYRAKCSHWPIGITAACYTDCRMGPHTFNERDHCRARCPHWPIRCMAGCCTRLSRGPSYFQFNEQDHYRAKCSHWPIGIMAACC